MSETYVVTTQYLENYGAHDGSGKFSDGEAYWKMKGGSHYRVTGTDRPANAMAYVMATCSQNSVYQKEFPIQVETWDKWLARLEGEGDEEWRNFTLENLRSIDPNEHNVVTLGDPRNK